jgi:hypothetical protein
MGLFINYVTHRGKGRKSSECAISSKKNPFNDVTHGKEPQHPSKKERDRKREGDDNSY